VPVVDIHVQAPGLSAREVERQVVQPLEQLAMQLPDLEHLYATSQRDGAVLTLRFTVGSDRDQAVFHTFTKLHSHTDRIPPAVRDWVIKPVEIDDVPIVVLGLWSRDSARLDAFQLRRLAEEMALQLQSLPNSNRVTVTGGPARQVRILLEPPALAARGVSALDVVDALQRANRLEPVGELTLGNRSITLESGHPWQPAQLADLVVAVIDGSPVSLREVARVSDGPAPLLDDSWLSCGAQHPLGESRDQQPLVTLAIAKRRGSN